MKKLGLAVALAALFVAPQTGRAVTANVGVTARIAPPLRITPVNDLNFGLLLSDGLAAGSSVISPAGVETLSASLTQLGTPAAGMFELQGRGGATVSTLTIGGTTLNCAADPLDPAADCTDGATLSMLVSNATNDFTGTLTAGAGLQISQVNFGAQLDVAADQASGEYTGVLLVTAIY